MVEAVQSGNDGTLWQPARGCSWWDAINSGHKDGYCNALIYRGWRCLAELETRCGQAEKAVRYTRLADKLQAVYADALYNPETGWLGWWRSADGQLHDPVSPLINGMAIEYGLVDVALGREILSRLWEKIRNVGFTRFELGVPSVLIPFRKGEYLQGIPPGECGVPARDDGTDTFGQYMNGGIHAGHVLPFLAAHYVVDHPEPAEDILQAMLQRLQLGLFQNGVWGESPHGTEWTTWNGEPSGADGYLADNFRFLEAVFLREPAVRTRLYRPLEKFRGYRAE